MKMINLIDTHVHFWDISNKLNNWLEDVPKLNTNYLIDKYLKDIKQLFNTDKIILIEAANSKDALNEIIWLESFTKNYNYLQFRFVPYIDMLAPSNDFKYQLSKFMNYKHISGFRHILSYSKSNQYSPCDYDFTLDLERIQIFISNIVTLTENNMVCELQMYPDQLLRIHPLLKAIPNPKIVIEHCGLPILHNSSLTQEWFEMLNAYRHMAYFKISGFELTGVESQISQIINEFLIRDIKLLFGSNLPVSNNENIMLILDKIKIKSDHLNINAERIYN